MEANHVPTSFNNNLMQLDNIIAKIGGMAEVQLVDAIDALLKRDINKAAHVIETDNQLDTFEAEVDNLAIQMLETRQPIAEDLRIITALMTASIIERIGDYEKI